MSRSSFVRPGWYQYEPMEPRRLLTTFHGTAGDDEIYPGIDSCGPYWRVNGLVTTSHDADNNALSELLGNGSLAESKFSLALPDVTE